MLLTERADLGNGTSELHMVFILYVIRITGLKSIIGPNSLFKSKCARPSSAYKRFYVQQESVLELRLMSAWRIVLRSRMY
eukprot:1151884-Pelagomonas_calceolata.AAC.1